MADDTKSKGTKSPDKTAYETALVRGYLGDVPEGKPDNSAYSLESGPDSPDAADLETRPRRA